MSINYNAYLYSPGNGGRGLSGSGVGGIGGFAGDRITAYLENQIFNMLDRNHDHFTANDVNQMMNNADSNHDGYITRYELDKYM